MTTGRSALIASVTEDLLNDVIAVVVGVGIPVDPLEQVVALPGMGDVDLRLELTVTGGRVEPRPDADGRVRAIATGLGVVSITGSAYSGEEADAGALGLPEVPAPIPVRVEALIAPTIELRSDQTLALGLDLAGAELVSLLVDTDAAVPEGVEPVAWAGITQVVQVMFHSLGDDLWAALGEHVGEVGTELGPEIGSVLADLGVAVGRADVRVGSGTITVVFAATDETVGQAEPVPVAGKRVGVGLSASGLDHLGRLLLERVLGSSRLPFEVELEVGEQQLGGRLRNTRIFDRLPDLRPSLRTEVRPRLVDGRLEVSLQAAWVELPSLVPSFVNDLSRRAGGLVSLAPMRVRFPSTIGVPVGDSGDTVPVHVEELRLTSSGVGVSLALD
jgi:hypothetical protein